MKQAHVFVSGFVQGVGYRQFVKYHAKKLGLAGWVRNLADRRVEAVIQGNEESLKKIIHRCNKGPFFAEVKNVAVEWEDVGEVFKDFIVTKQ